MPRITARATLLPLGLMLGLSVCTPMPVPVPEPAPAPAPPAGTRVVRLDADQAARLAEEAREGVEVKLADGLQLALWASDSLVTDPVAISFDNRGRLYVTRSNRITNSEFDIRGHRNWMVESITFEDVEDRRRFLRRELAPERSEQNAWFKDLNEDGSIDWRDLLVEKEQLFRIMDTDGDGRADVSQLMLEDFNTEVSDLALGVLAHDDQLYLTVSPDLWRLRDENGDGVIDSKESLSHGYGVHIGFGSHGLSSPVVGPDGRLYWAIGDLGLNVVDQSGRRWSYPHQGAIMRSELDGSNFEVFAAGLRNPHEFAFDELGNLITVDNDGDHPGEKERLVYIVDGSDSGWRINWQFGKYIDPDNNAYKVWMNEGLWKPRFEGQAAHIVPPLASYHTGPAGMVYNPGTALGPEWRDHFFVSEFTGSPATSQVHAFRLEPSGAGFRLAGDRPVVGGILTSGMEFGPDGALYLADWVEGWGDKERGRIWQLDVPGAADSPQRLETAALLAASFERRGAKELMRLLEHADMRVRLKAQWELAERSEAGALLRAARQRDNRLARLHGIWGLGQLARRDAGRAEPLVALLRDADAEVRANAARVLGDVRHAAAAPPLVELLKDPEPRVRFFAAEALGRIGHAGAVQPMIAMLEQNDDRDVYLRHAGTLALARIGEAGPVVALAEHPSRALRVAAVVALRRMGHPGVARFLGDRDEYVVTEAARAINDDGSIEAALPALARVLEDERFRDEQLLRRAINANLRVGTAEAARRVATFAARRAAPPEARVEAVAVLGVWPRPSVLDRVDGAPRGAVTRDTTIARAALARVVDGLLVDASAPVRMAAAEAVGRLQLDAAAPALLARVREDAAPEVRIAALRALQVMRSDRIEPAVRAALADRDQTVRMTALGFVPQLGVSHEKTAELLSLVLERGSVQEQQSAIAALGQLQSPYAHRALGRLLDQWGAGRLAPEVQLDLAEAVEASNARVLRTRLQQVQSALPQGNATAAFHDALLGGNAELGRRVVLQHPAGQCTRCHTISGEGPNVGPPLGRIGAALTREQLLEALVEPSARIAPGYGVPGAPSAMPPMGHILSRREIRDVVEYLSTLR